MALIAAQPADSLDGPRESLSHTHTRSELKSYATKVFRREVITRKALRRVKHLRVYQRNHIQRKRALRDVRRLRRLRKQRQQLLALTPYSCGRHGRFAIPCYIVQCESRFDWNAYNPSGAWGAYQLLGWLPVGSSRMAQHRMAAKLWNGGAGASHWVCA